MLTAQPATSAGSLLQAKLSRSRIGASNVAGGAACMAGAGLEGVMGSGPRAGGGCSAGSEECTVNAGSDSASGVQSVPHRAQRTA